MKKKGETITNDFNNWTYLEKFFQESFDGGRIRRELRLSDEEINYLKQKYSNITFSLIEKTNSSKHWYLITIGNK